jgi:hypothetical protein
MKTTETISIFAWASPSQAALDAIIVLKLYGAGRGGIDPVRAALDRLDALYGLPLQGALALYRQSLITEDADRQTALRFAALTRMTDWVFRHPAAAGLWGIFAKIRHGLGRGLGHEFRHEFRRGAGRLFAYNRPASLNASRRAAVFAFAD